MDTEQVRQTYAIVLWSPLHIDAGMAVRKHSFRLHNCQFIRYDEEVLLEEIANDEDLLNRFITEGAKALPLDHPACMKAEIYRVDVDFSAVPSNVHPHISDGTGKLYIPGSSIKGAIRTALLWTNLDMSPEIQEEILDQRDSRWAGEPLQKATFAKDPTPSQWQNYDLMRALKVRDSNGLLPKRHTRVMEMRVGSLRRYGEIKGIYTTHVECPRAQPGEFHIDVLIDKWLIYNAEAQRLLDFQSKAEWLNGWGKRCNQFAEHLIQHELSFARQYQIQSLKRFYKDLRCEMNTRPNSAFLQVGWGAGWVSKTIAEGYGQDFIDRARRQFILGKIRHRGCNGEIRQGRYDAYCLNCKQTIGDRGTELMLVKPFPKSRKVVFRNGEPWQPMGWMELRPVEG